MQSSVGSQCLGVCALSILFESSTVFSEALVVTYVFVHTIRHYSDSRLLLEHKKKNPDSFFI